jgi:hypothetical protein
MTCPRPIDPIDAEAIASGAEPVFDASASSHAAECPSCGERVRDARSLVSALEGLSGPPQGLSELAARVTRLRTFSRQERRTYALWSAPVSLTVGLTVAGFALLALPGLTAREQASLGLAALAPALALARSAAQWLLDLVRLSPPALQALSDGLRGEGALGLTALLLLAPLGLGLNRILSRAHGRK